MLVNCSKIEKLKMYKLIVQRDKHRFCYAVLALRANGQTNPTRFEFDSIHSAESIINRFAFQLDSNQLFPASVCAAVVVCRSE